MRPHSHHRLGPVLALLIVALTFGSALAGDTLLTVRITSLDALLDDVGVVAGAVGQPLDRGEFLASLEKLSPAVILDQVDFQRPLVFVMPMEGMLLQDKGVVAVVPVKDVDAALAELIRAVEGAKTEGAITELPFAENRVLYVQPAQGYLMAAFNRQITEDAVLGDLLEIGPTPPGNISATVQIAPIAPLIQMGLMQAQAMAQQQTQGEAAKVEALANPLEIYGSMIGDALANVASISFSLEVSGANLLYHQWVLPKSGSTLEAFIAAQQVDWPELARFADPQAPLVIVNNFTMTDAARAAFNGWAEAQAAALGQTARQTGSAQDSPLLFYRSFSQLGTQCNRGDGVASMWFDKGFLPRVAGIQGWLAGEPCQDIPATMARVLGEGAENFVHGKMQAWKQSLPMPSDETQEPTDSAPQMNMAFGKLGDLLLSAVGSDAPAALTALADRVEASRGSGVAPADFAPLETGPGYFMRIDLEALAANLRAMQSAQLPDEMSTKIANLEGGQVVSGVLIGHQRLDFRLAVPLDVIAALTSDGPEKEAGEAQEADATESP